jgi:ferredoxin
MGETLQIDRIRCDGHGLCAELLPELIRLDDWGYPIIKAGTIPPSLIEHARRAADACPVLALRLARIGSLAVAPAFSGRLRPAASARLQTG